MAQKSVYGGDYVGPGPDLPLPKSPSSSATGGLTPQGAAGLPPAASAGPSSPPVSPPPPAPSGSSGKASVSPDVGPVSTEAASSAESASRRARGRPKGSKNKPKENPDILTPAVPHVKPQPIEALIAHAESGFDRTVDPLPPVAVPPPDLPPRRRFKEKSLVMLGG